MNFSINKKLPIKVSTAALFVQEFFYSKEFEDFLNEIKEIFPQSNIDGPTLLQEIERVLKEQKSISIMPYTYPWYQYWRNNSVNAHVRSGSTTIYLTSNYVSRANMPMLVKTIAHEVIHSIDNCSPYFFGHGDNDPTGDELTASHVIGDFAQRVFLEVESSFWRRGPSVENIGYKLFCNGEISYEQLKKHQAKKGSINSFAD